jgi:hypothetical protein
VQTLLSDLPAGAHRCWWLSFYLLAAAIEQTSAAVDTCWRPDKLCAAAALNASAHHWPGCSLVSGLARGPVLLHQSLGSFGGCTSVCENDALDALMLLLR